MKIFDALAALRIARWALEHHDLIPADVRADVALLAERGGQKLPPGLFAAELALLRGGPFRGMGRLHRRRLGGRPTPTMGTPMTADLPDPREGRALLDRFATASPMSEEEIAAADAWYTWLLDNGETLLDSLERVYELLYHTVASAPLMYGDAPALLYRAETAEATLARIREPIAVMVDDVLELPGAIEFRRTSVREAACTLRAALEEKP